LSIEILGGGVPGRCESAKAGKGRRRGGEGDGEGRGTGVLLSRVNLRGVPTFSLDDWGERDKGKTNLLLGKKRNRVPIRARSAWRFKEKRRVARGVAQPKTPPPGQVSRKTEQETAPTKNRD